MRTAWQSVPTCFVVLGLAANLVYGERTSVSYAENFSIEHFDTHKLLTVRNMWRGSNDQAFVYALVPKGVEVPKLPEEAQLIRTPVDRVSIFETVYLGHFQALDLYERLVGLAHFNLTSDVKARAQVENGYTKRIQTGSSVDIETLMLLRSDVVFTSAMGDPQFDVHPQLLRGKQPVVVTAGYMEAHPLGRSEWIKFTAAFFDKEDEAAVIFDRIARRYLELAKLAKTAGSRPIVFANAPFGGVWHVPGGQSYTARAIADAGGEYIFSDDRSMGGVPKDFESVYFKAADADIWIHPGTPRTLAGMLSMDERFSRFKAFGEGAIYNNTRQIRQGGGNEIWERGVLHPEETLADLIAIFHPELLPDHSLVYYEQLK